MTLLRQPDPPREVLTTLRVLIAEPDADELRHDLAVGRDRRGVPMRVSFSWHEGLALYVERAGEPARCVRLDDLLAAVLDAGPGS